MKFAEKLKKAMQELNLNQRQVVTMTGKSKGSVRLDVTKAAKLMGMNHNTVRKGLQQGVFPWGYAVHTSDNRWSYFINAKRFAEVEGIAL